MCKNKKLFITKTPAETIALGKKIARSLKPNNIIYLAGELGSGKTTFTKGICLGLDVKTIVTSPSFVIASEYEGKLRVCHIDLYRLCANDFATLPLEEYYIADGVTIIEWADRLPNFPKYLYPGIYIIFNIINKNKRAISIEDFRN